MSEKGSTKDPTERVLMIEHAIALIKSGIPPSAAWSETADKFGVHRSTLYRWFQKVDGAPRGQWESRLGTSYKGRSTTAECDPNAYNFFKNRVRVSKTHKAAYDALRVESEKKGWVIPSLRTLQKRIAADGVTKPTRYDDL